MLDKPAPSGSAGTACLLGTACHRSPSFPAIGCADSKDLGVVEAEQRWAEDQQKAPIYGKYFGAK